MTNINVRYVGAKDSETDHVAGTGKTWTGHGDVQTVPAKAWEIMSRHPDVWELTEDPAEIVAGALGDATLKSAEPAAAVEPEPDLEAEPAAPEPEPTTEAAAPAPKRKQRKG